MLATLVIGLREGLEATLVVGIIAAFLRRNRVPLTPMWIGVGTAVLLSIGVGLGLQAVEQALPQAQQEGMEAVIGAVAVVFVTGMVVWMRTHARGLAKELEASARSALGRGTAWALAAMAFLAVLKEGFETAVFLLATFQASSDTGLAALGAVIGIAAAVLVGYGLYTGGVRLDLGRFFTGTGVFLVLVAGGLVLTVLRRAHEAGWIVIGQQRTVDLSWLAPAGSVQGALVTGVLGIPADPRVVEVTGWLLYVVPVLALSLWPRAWRPSPAHVPRVRVAVATGLAVAAVALVVALPTGGAHLAATQRASGGRSVTATVAGSRATLQVTGTGREAPITFPTASHRTLQHAGTTADRWQVRQTESTADRPTRLTLDDLVDLLGRVPVGVTPDTAPGPYEASWSASRTTNLWTAAGGVLDATSAERTVLTVRGGGLQAGRTVTLDRDVWSVPDSRVARAATLVAAADTRAAELALWNAWLPTALGVVVLVQLGLALRDRRSATSRTAPDPVPVRGPPAVDPARSPAHAVR